MNILDSLLNAGNGAVVSQLASKFGLDPSQATAALSSLLPALASGVQRNAASPGGLEQLTAALRSGGHERYLDDPSTLAAPETVQDGNGILGHIFGTKEASRQVAGHAAEKSGISADILKKMLPVVASLVMAQLAKKQASAPADAGAVGSDGGGLLGALGGLADLDKDGKVEASDLLGMAKKFL